MSLSILTVAEMRAWEAASWAAGIRAEEVIRRVGQRIGDWLLAHTDREDRLIFLIGAGNNGADARAAARWIGWRRPCLELVVTEPGASHREVLRDAFRQGADAGRPVWLIDGLFGIGLNREFSPGWREFIEWLNQETGQGGATVVSIDVPTGLSGDGGETAGALVQAHYTLTVGAPKCGLIGLAAAGRVEVLRDVGLLVPAEGHLSAAGFRWLDSTDFTQFPPRRPMAGHKGTFGHVMVVAGSAGFHGAAVLSARAALRAGPGLVSVLTLPESYPAVAAQLAQPMVHAWHADWPVPDSVTAVVMGPGLAAPNLPAAFWKQLARLWHEFPGPVLADASALARIAMVPGISSGPRLITPHPGEAARVLDTTPAVVLADRRATARSLQKRIGPQGTAILKGFHTLLAHPDGGVEVNPTGNPGLAQGGSGDVLSGFLGGLLAQRLPMARAAAYGVWEHGAAADRLAARHRVWTMDELLAELGEG